MTEQQTSTRQSDRDGDEEDDDTFWEPLLPSVSSSRLPSQDTNNNTVAAAAAAATTQQRDGLSLRRRQQQQKRSIRDTVPTQEQQGQPVAATSPAPRNNNNKRKQNIVNHPMQRVASHFCVHLCRQVVWKLDWNLQLALACFFIGGVFQVVVWCFYFALYPEHLRYYCCSVSFTILATTVWFYFFNSYDGSFIDALETLQNPDQLADWLGRSLNSTQLRLVMALLAFGVPLVLEMRTLHFLSSIVTRGAFASNDPTYLLLCYGCAVALGCYHVYSSSQKKNKDQQDLVWYFYYSPRECTQKLLYLLYGSALLVVFRQGTDWRHIPTLAARFFLATAVLLWKATDSTSASEAVQDALRLTVRDALQEVNSSVQEDEMLQLAMLRWIADYWSSSSSSSSTHHQSSSTSTTTSPTNATPSPQPHQPHDLEWTELWGMLQTTTNQMAAEVQTLQDQQQEEEASISMDQQSTVVSSSAETASLSIQQSGQSRPTSGSNNNTTFLASGGSASNEGRQRQQSSNNSSSNGMMYDLQTMLATMDIDDRAKPAVLAYKRAVEAFPPSRRTAIVLGTTQRCPALLLLLFYFVAGTVVGLLKIQAPTMVVLLLFPFFVIEVLRIRMWIQACNEATGNVAEDDTRSYRSSIIHQNVKPMTILLMNESYCVSARLPNLLLVWQNVCASVSALQVGLTAARCAQTTTVAVEFAANIMSLADFGYEVSRHGWLHGLTILAQELFHLHTTGTDLSSLSQGRSPPPMGARYTGAAVNALRNSRTMSRNVQALMEEEHSSRLVGPLLGFVSMLVGQGWLWGRDNLVDEHYSSHAAQTRSTVVIEELDDDHEVTVANPENDPTGTTPLNPSPDEATCSSVLKSAETTSLRENSEHSDDPRNSAPDTHGLDDSNTECRRGEGSTNGVAHATPQDNADTGARLFETESAEMMDLLARCVECGILDVAEKDSMLEKLAEMVGAQDVSSLVWVRGNTISLRRLIDQSIAMNAVASSDTNDAPARQHTADAARRIESLNLPPDSSVDSKGCVDIDKSDDDSFIGLDGQHFETLQLGDTENGALSVSSEDSSVKMLKERASSEIETGPGTSVVTRDLSIERSGDDDDFEPLNIANSEGCEEAHSPIMVGLTNDTPASMKETENDEDNLWLKVGGGLALVGAVVAGGVALANAQNGDDDRKRRSSNGGNVSVSERSNA